MVKVRVDGVVRNRPAYLVLGLNTDGKKEALALVMGSGDESAKFWLKVLNDLRNRGLKTVCIVCCDGLTALPEAVEAVFADAWVQTCVVHYAEQPIMPSRARRPLWGRDFGRLKSA